MLNKVKPCPSRCNRGLLSGKKVIFCALAVFFFVVQSAEVKATHNAGLDISYKCLGGNDSFRVEIAYYRDCAGASAPATMPIDFSSSCFPSFSTTAIQVSSTEIIPYCPAALPTECTVPFANPSREQYIYVDTIILPGQCSDWIISTGTCCRNGAINTAFVDPFSTAIYVEATLNNTISPCNSSPFFTTTPAPFVYAGQTFCYNNGAVDINGDSLAYSLIWPKTGPAPGDTIDYDPGYTPTQPLTSVPPITFDPTTGDICMTPAVVGEVTVLGLLVEEYRFGTLVGSVMRDIQITVIAGADNLPSTNGINGAGTYRDTIAAGCAYTFFTNTDDSDPGDCLTLSSNASTAILGSSFPTVAGCGPAFPTGTFTWTPSTSDISNTPHCFVTALFDDACPVNGSEIRAWCLTVVEYTANFTSSAPACIQENVNFYSQYNYSGYSYLWDFGQDAIVTYDQTISPNPDTVSYATSGAKTVVLSITSPSGCIARDTSVITINPRPVSSFTNSAPACVDEGVDFFNLGSSGVGVTYSWGFGPGSSPSTSIAENPSGVTYSTAGDKIITLNVTNQFGCTSTATDTIVINPKPTVSFSSTAPGCTDRPVYFVNTGTTGATSYYWSFGSGSFPATSIDENPIGIEYSTDGVKSVKLVITLGACVDSSMQTINITEKPAPGIAAILPACEGTVIDFDYFGIPGVGWTFDWDFGAGASPAISTAEDPAGIVYSGAGPKTVTLTVTNGICSETFIELLTIDPTPVADFTSTAPSCTGDSVDFANTGTSGATYLWDFGSGASPASSIDENPVNIVYSTDGIKTVSLTTTLGACVDASVQTINITDTPAPSFVPIADTCEGAAIDFTYTGTTDTNWTYQWDFGTGANPPNSTIQNPVGITYTGPGSKTVTLTVANGMCTEVFVQTHTILPTPVADFTSTAPSCTGDSVDFVNTGTVGATSYNWDFGLDASPATSMDENPANIIYSTDGIKSVKLITMLGSCVDSIIQTINITETPAPGFAPIADACEGSAIDFIYTGTTDTNWTYQWDFGTGANPPNSTIQNPLGITYTGPGSKIVTLTVANGMCTEVFVQTHTILQTPVADFTSTAMTTPACTGNSVDFENTGTTGAGYSWVFGSGASPASSIDENPTGVTYTTAGIKTVRLITTLGSCVDTSIQTININQTPAVSFNSNTPVCAGEGATFTNTGSTGGDWTFSWDFGAGALPATSTSENPLGVIYSYGGTKTVTFTITDGICINTSTGSIVINSLPIADAGQDTTICADQSVQIGSAPVGGNTYSWFPSSTLDNPSIADPIASPIATITMYIVTVMETATGCENVDTVIVTMVTSALVDAGPDVEMCFGDAVQIGSALVEGQTYAWMPTAGLDNSAMPNPIASPDSTTIYTVSVSYEGCDTITDDVLATVHPLPNAKATDSQGRDTTYITLGSSVQLMATGGVQYEWTPETDLDFADIYNPVASPNLTTDYVAVVTDLFGCVNRDTVRVEVDSLTFFIPTAFTPDGNGISDIFFVRIAEVVDFELIIFNRWGEQLFISRDVFVGWDGRKQDSGKELPEGAYVYSFKGTTVNGEEISENGIINLIR